MTGMRPTSQLHIGNYFGALKPLLELQHRYQTFLMIADMHALTTLENTKTLRDNTLTLAMLYLAAGIHPKKVTLFVQSEVPEHAELATLLSMITPVSMLELNPVYKDMLKEHPKATNLGLLAYPVLQAADILLYKAEVVPVGKDQLPHLELAREIARRFNHRFGDFFTEPGGLVEQELKILSLQDSSKKMSKSHSESSQIYLLDPPEKIHKKIKTAVTDSGKDIVYDPHKKPALSNLILLMHLASGESIQKIEERFHNRGYGEFKEAVTSALIMLLTPIQIEFDKLSKNKKGITKILNEGSKKARMVAQKNLVEIKKKIGLLAS